MLGAPDPGPYTPTTGFTLSVYGRPIAAFGDPHPSADQRQHPTSSEAGVLTTFHAPVTGELTAVAALASRPRTDGFGQPDAAPLTCSLTAPPVIPANLSAPA